MNRLAFFSLLIAAIVLCVCGRKDRNVPHGHIGILKAHAPGPFEVELQASDEQVLSSGKSVMKQVMPKPGETDSAGGVFCVQDIEAPKEAVWNQILGMDEYERKVAKVLECKNYEVSKNENGSITIKTRQKLGVLPGYSVSTSRRLLLVLFLKQTVSNYSSHFILCSRSMKTTTITPMYQRKTRLRGALITRRNLTSMTLLAIGMWRIIQPSR